MVAAAGGMWCLGRRLSEPLRDRPPFHRNSKQVFNIATHIYAWALLGAMRRQVVQVHAGAAQFAGHHEKAPTRLDALSQKIPRLVECLVDHTGIKTIGIKRSQTKSDIVVI